MKEPRFDRTRDFGEVHPAGTAGIFYWQDGLPFCHEGKLVKSALTDDMKKRLSQPASSSASKPSGQGQKASAPSLSYEQMKALADLDMLSEEQKAAFESMTAPEPGKPPNPNAEKSDGDGGEEEVNLELWLKGEENYAFFKVTNAVFERYHKKCVRQDDVVQFLVLTSDGPHVIPAVQVAEKFKKYLDGAAKD